MKTHTRTHTHTPCTALFIWVRGMLVCVCVKKHISHHFQSHPHVCGGSTVYQEGVCESVLEITMLIKIRTSYEDSKS